MEALNIQLSPFFQWLLKTSLQGSLLICLILLIKLVLRGKLPVRWHYYLWLLLLVRLALPWAPQSRLSMFNLIPQYSSPERAGTALTTESTGDAEAHTTANSETIRDTAEHATVEQQTVQPKPATPESKLTSTSAPVVPEAVSPDRSDSTRPVSVGLVRILPLAWLLGAIALGGYVAVRNFNLWRTIKRERPITNSEILELLEDCKMQMNVQTIVGVIVTDRVKSPALFGFVRPRLLLPQGLIEALDIEELHYVFLHELAHLKRRDIYLGWLVSLLQVMHWFNPLIWFALRRMRTDQELACDGLALSTMNTDEPPKYGRTIVNLFERFSQVSYMPSIAGILEEPSQLERRIKMIAKFRQKSYQRSPLAVILIIILACISLPDAKRTKASETTDRETAPHISLRRVWSPLYSHLLGELSPDGRYLSYVDWGTGDLAIHEIATGKKRRITDKGSWEESNDCADASRWSPDGKQIAYCWDREEDDGSVDLRIIGLDSSESRILYSTNEQTRWVEPCAWFPDGKRILAHLTGKDGTDQIVQFSITDGSFRVLKTVGKDCLARMQLSPDGQYIVYEFTQEKDKDPSNRDISLISIDGSREISLVEHPADDSVLGWAPDGKNILFASDRTGILGMWLLAVADGKQQVSPVLIKPDIGQLEPLGFSRTGSFYYCISRDESDDIYIAGLDPETGKIQAPPKKAIQRYEGSNVTASYSPDGKYLAYIYRAPTLTYTHTRRVLCIRSLETDKDQDFTFDFTLGPDNLRWSPDSRSLLVTGIDNKNNRRGLFQVDAQTGDAKLIIPQVREGGVSFHSFEWSRDGKSIFYVHLYEFCQILVRDLKSGTEKELYRSADSVYSPYRIDVSPDGKWLALSSQMRKRGLRSIKFLPVTGGEPRELCKFDEKGGWFTWSVDGKYILFARQIREDLKELCRIPVEGGEIEKLGLEMPQIRGISFYPDGRNIVFSSLGSTPKTNEVWVMENFLPEAPVAKPEPTTTVRKVGYEWRGPFANLSPDGKYMSDRDWDTGTLVVHELATGKSRTLVGGGSDEAGEPLVSAISPDSKEVAYLWHDPNTKASSLHVVGLDGAGHRVLCKGKYPMPMSWSADGQKILAVVSENDVQRMVWISASDGSIQHIIDVSRSYPGKLDVSSDGRFIAYDCPQGEDASKRDIFVFDMRENREFSVINHPADDKFLGWTPDGRHIFFSSDRTGTWDAWLLPVANGKPQGFPELARHGIGNITPIGFTPQGSYYYGHEQTLRDVFVAKLDLESGEFLSEPVPVRQSGATTSHDWSPDGRYLAYCTGRPDESQAVHIRTLATGRERTLSSNLPSIRWLRWSPDGRSIIADGFKKGDSQGAISKIDVQTSERIDIVTSTTEVLIRPEMSPDGKTLFYDRADPGLKTCRLIARDLESGREKELFRAVSPAQLTNRTLSPDGQRFVLSIVPDPTRPLAPVLKILSVAGGEPRELIQFDKSENLRAVGVTWTPDSRSVLFWKWCFPADKELELWRISAEGGESRRLCSRKAFGHMRVHPDGQRVAFYDRSTTRELWVMENFLPKAIASAQK